MGMNKITDRVSVYALLYIVIAHLLFFSGIAIAQTTTVNYTPSTLNFPNPERGIYHHTETHSNAYDALNATTLSNYRNNESITLILRLFYLDDFVNAPISNNYLNQLQADFNTIRNAEFKCIVRFAYTNQTIGWPPASPYGDATKAWMLSHIAQLEPYLRNNSDIIAFVQTGFIGIWGEWYYTTYFGDPAIGNPTAANFADRKEITDRLLTALPTNRMIQLRTPYFKYRMYRAGVLTPVSFTESFNGSPVSRIGHHNDCFLASADDFGTYLNKATEGTYLGNDTRYVPMGGETCQLNAPRSNCSGDALNELSAYHWSFINKDYINTVWNAWTTQGCLPTIQKNLGYRIQLNSGTYTSTVKPGSSISISLNLTNVGWASMYNPRLLEFILVNTSDGKVCKATTSEEPRTWQSGNTLNVNYEIGIPANYPNGQYKLYLSLPDPETNLYEKAAYSVRLANDNTTWDNVKGYNYLNFDLTINNALSTPAYTGSLWFSNCYGSLPLEWINFSAEMRDEETMLHWTTAHEVMTDYFLIQKSIDGETFQTIGKVAASSTQGNNYYTFTYPYRNEGISYYRLTQYNSDGSFSYSKVIQIHQNNEQQIYVSPNPFTDNFQLFMEGFDPKEAITIQLKDINGKVLLEEIKENSKTLLIPTMNIRPGVYIVHVQSAQGSIITKVVKVSE